MQEVNVQVTALNTSCKRITTKLTQEVEEAKHEMATLQAKYEKREERIHELGTKQRRNSTRRSKKLWQTVGRHGRLKQLNFRYCGLMPKTGRRKDAASTN